MPASSAPPIVALDDCRAARCVARQVAIRRLVAASNARPVCARFDQFNVACVAGADRSTRVALSPIAAVAVVLPSVYASNESAKAYFKDSGVESYHLSGSAEELRRD